MNYLFHTESTESTEIIYSNADCADLTDFLIVEQKYLFVGLFLADTFDCMFDLSDEEINLQ